LKKVFSLFIMLFFVLSLLLYSQEVQTKSSQQKYQPTWGSLKQHSDPEWFKDAKFGIYTHWGPITFANLENPDGWYGNHMYMDSVIIKWDREIVAFKPHRTYIYHVKKWGDPTEFGYKDLIYLFKPTRFDAEKWAELFKRAGAQFAGPVAIHHDNFAMWDSKVTRWNIKRIANIDVVGELEKAIRKRGMKFFVSFHHSYSWFYYYPSYRFDGKNLEYEDLYCPVHRLCDRPNKKYLKLWYGKIDEVLVKYKPDLIWFDFGLGYIPERYRKKLLARYYNLGVVWGKEVGVCYKNKEEFKKPTLPDEAGILDFERGRANKLLKDVWLTDTSVSSWFYNVRSENRAKTTNEIVDMLVDIVSKNGCLLLNVPPKPDGTIPEFAQKILLNIGGWLKVNGEAIYGTRPWIIYGEGPMKLKEGGHFSEKNKIVYTAKDIRFTTKNNDLFAIFLDWPQNNKVVIQSLKSNSIIGTKKIRSIILLGSNKQLKWKQTDQGLEIELPSKKPCKYAYSLKISLEGKP